MDNVWLYEVLGESWGVVKATTREEAERKVRDAYKKHDTCYNEDTSVIIKSKDEDNTWFTDCPDVIEVYG